MLEQQRLAGSQLALVSGFSPPARLRTGAASGSSMRSSWVMTGRKTAHRASSSGSTRMRTLTAIATIKNPPTGVGTLLTGAIGVYTKTITMDGSSLWSSY